MVKEKSGKLKVRQVRSQAGYDKRTRAVISALGLGKIGKTRTFASSNAALRGQIERVSHLVEIVEGS